MDRSAFLRFSLGAMLLGGLTLMGLLRAPAEDAPAKARLRRPIALALADDGKLLLAANRRSGTVSVLDAATLRPVAEVEVGRTLSDLVAVKGGSLFLATDEEAGELLLLHRQGATLEVAHRLKVGHSPVSVQVSPDGGRCTVAARWAHRVIVVELPANEGRKPRVVREIDLPFAPRAQLLLADGVKLVVADAFGGQLAVVDVAGGEVESVRPLPGHNLRGLALAPGGDRLLVTHQMLNPLATTSHDDVHWGNLLTNNLRSLALADLHAAKADLLRGSRLDYFGDVGQGAGDPAGLAVGADGRMVIALAGVDEVAVGRDGGLGWDRLAVGRRPTAVLLAPDGKRAYVANTFSDSVSVVDLKAGKVQAEVALGPQPELTPADRGELMFHDARLSLEGWFSCQSCHPDGHSSGRLADTLGDGTFGTPKRTLSLLGVRDSGPWAWTGGVAALEDQVRKSLRTTMQGPEPSAEQVQDLTAYLKTLAPPPPLAEATGRADAEAAGRGRAVFTRLGCAACHAPPAYTSAKAYNVGLADEKGQTLFNPPSLRGVGHGGPFFHDGRAATLEEVFTRHRHQLKDELAEQELEDLLAFLRSL